MSRNNSPNPALSSAPLDPLMAAYTTKRRPSRSEASGQLPPRSVSPLPPAPTHSTPPSTSSTSVSSSLSSVQHAAGSWWKRASASASALYQQAALQLADEPTSASGHKRSHSRRNSAASADTLPAAAVSSSANAPTHPTISSSATSPSFNSAPPPSSAAPSSFLSSVLSSVSAAVSNVSATASNSLAAASTSSHTGIAHDASHTEGNESEVEAGFVELDLLDKYFDHPNAYINHSPATITTSTTTTSNATDSTPSTLPSVTPLPIAAIDQSPLSLSVARMSLLASVLSAEPGGYLSSDVFFPRAALFVPSLRLPALPQKLSALERFDEVMEEAENRTAAGRVVAKDGQQQQQEEVERWQSGMAAVLASCHRLQNELAFSLSSIKESHSSSTSSADGESETMTADDSGVAAESTASSSAMGIPVAGSAGGAATSSSSTTSSSHSSGLTVDKLSSRVKAFGYSVAKTASRISKQVLQDKVSREQADVYAALVSRIARHMQRLQQHCTELVWLHGERDVQSRVNELGVFVCEVIVVFIVDDLQRCMTLYTQQQQDALSRGYTFVHVLQVEQESRKKRVAVQQKQEGAATAAYAERAEASAATLYAEMVQTSPELGEASNSSTDMVV